MGELTELQRQYDRVDDELVQSRRTEGDIAVGIQLQLEAEQRRIIRAMRQLAHETAPNPTKG